MYWFDRRFGELPDDEFAARTKAIVAGLNANAASQPSISTVEVISAALRDFRKALAVAEGTSERESRIRTSRSILEWLLEKLVWNSHVGGNAGKARPAKRDFSIQRNGCGPIPVGAPAKVRIKPTGVSGQVHVLCASVQRAKAYQVQFADSPIDSPWSDGGTFGSTRRMMVGKLVRAKDYWFRIRAIGAAGPGDWSETATILVS